jgi:hypothetical protein
MSRLTTVFRLSLADKCLLLETLAFLALARMAVLYLPFRWVAAVLGKPEAQTPEHDDLANLRGIRRIASMVRRTSRNVPWTSKCLDQAIAAKILLRRRGIATTVYFGVKNDESGELDAHAWLRSGTCYVTGGAHRERYTIINTFAAGRT